MPMKNRIHEKGDELLIQYSWKDKNWHSIEIVAENKVQQMEIDSEFEFITEHYWGFTKKKTQLLNMKSVIRNGAAIPLKSIGWILILEKFTAGILRPLTNGNPFQ